MTRSVLYLAAGLVLIVSYFAMAATQRPTQVSGYLVVATCGTLATAYVAGTYQAPTVDTTGKTCVNQ
jgi:hypothetical protein